MSALDEWPVVKVDEYGQMTCPIPRCDGLLHLVRSYAIPLVAEEATDHEPQHAVSDVWSVECIEGHKIHDHVDQIREMNACSGDEEGDLLDETCESAPEYDHWLTHQRIHALLGLGGNR